MGDVDTKNKGLIISYSKIPLNIYKQICTISEVTKMNKYMRNIYMVLDNTATACKSKLQNHFQYIKKRAYI